MAKILIADDDQAIREMLRMMLETFNYEVLTANDGQEALAIIQASQERLIVMLDLFMPLLNGHDILRNVSEDEALATRHAYILLTAHHHLCLSEFKNAALQITLLTKPFAMEDLLHIVEEAAQKIRTPLPVATRCK